MRLIHSNRLLTISASAVLLLACGSAGAQTFEVTAPGRDKASELATAVARLVLAKLGP